MIALTVALMCKRDKVPQGSSELQLGRVLRYDIQKLYDQIPEGTMVVIL
jgi:hypothetical protein